jgi:hypothetical protein
VVDTLGIEERRAALDAVHFISLFEKKLRQIGAVLTGNSSNQSLPHREVLLLPG